MTSAEQKSLPIRPAAASEPHDADKPRPGEVAVALPDTFDAGLYYIGRIRTPWTRRADCPRNARQSEAVCTLELDPRFAPALAGVEASARLLVLYWMDRARRDLVVQAPRHADGLRGTFSLRSPVRPNPIAASVVTLLGIEGTRVRVVGLDCIDGTPLIDLKPHYPTIDGVGDTAREVTAGEPESGSGTARSDT
ncbi:hypothetical protein A33M_3829 [Rhodovulum sp. PH10]|uniref:tRNA (N6-threonylcarbamoyladenosine(37)-N6)-methyltransferase TrmO n=1 Tax=Rhodovulum sp. PH10 TaxID=1187851 RepID=UPI00027C25D4|nr:tRNA (N6-threonylcarbamoyladenosine(37)-N6)-methyltransferase TrmO [Rhodovulum sp. PH10]EJW13409.1 hypothetical protein A33M_3829 [Rhodovulum sp. PH10]